MPNEYDNDPNFETIIGQDGRPVRVLRDGGRATVGLMMADAARRGSAMLHDGHGGRVGSRPGFIVNDAAERTRREAWEQSCHDLRDAWKTPDIQVGAYGPSSPGSLEPVRSYAAPFDPHQPFSMADAQAIRDAAYREMCPELANAWRCGHEHP
jgi:hypothetical protein